MVAANPDITDEVRANPACHLCGRTLRGEYEIPKGCELLCPNCQPKVPPGQLLFSKLNDPHQW
jgi:hypothetical protein